MTREEPEILAEQGEGFLLRKIKRLVQSQRASKVAEVGSEFRTTYMVHGLLALLPCTWQELRIRGISVEARDRKNKASKTLNLREMEGTRKLTPEHM